MKNNIKHNSRLWIIIWFVILGIFYYIIRQYVYPKNIIPQVCNWENCFSVEIARTPDERQKGLMYRTSIAQDKGMIFVFSKSDLYNFRMKNTFIPLDMIRIDESFRVVRILTAQPCISDPCRSYKPEIGAKYVLEVNAGMSTKYKIVEWTIMKFKNIK